ncbi:MAG: phosphate signaling complex protein PhoU [Bacillota bacterium]|nr:phosphate signaling complex protein PhoU [Bacillota bacterium]
MSKIRENYSNALKELQHEILRMGALVEQAVGDAVDSLKKQDLELAQKVINGDDLIDKLELEIEDKCLKLIATQQPMAKDLRRIGTGFKLIADLERVGDYAVDIAKITLRIGSEPLLKPLIDIPRMAKMAQEMLKDSLDSYVREDVELASTLKERDDEVDHIYAQIYRELLTYMLADPKTINQATFLMFVGRYLERIGDHTTNVGESVIFLVTGEREELND